MNPEDPTIARPVIVRHVNRRRDPLKRRTPDLWLVAFASLRRISPAVVVAAKRVSWDYPQTAIALRPLTGKYLDLTRLPPPGLVGRVLARVGYPLWQVARSLRSYAAGRRKDRFAINLMEHHLRGLTHAAWRDENEEDRRYGRSSLPEIRLRV